MRLTRLVAGAFVLASSAALLAQQPATFRSEVNFVELDAIVTDHLGHFVPGLSAADFTVREGHVTAAVETFDTVDLPIPGRATRAVAAPARLNPSAALPSGALDGRIYLLYFDVPFTGENLINAKRHGRDFIARYLQPGDIAAVWSSQSPVSTITFTNDQAALLAQVEHFDTGATGASGASTSTKGLRDAADLLRSVQGRRKSLLLFTTGHAMGMRIPLAPNAHNRPTAFDRVTVDEAHPYWQNPEEEGVDLQGLADVHIYPVDVRGLTAPPLGRFTPGSPAYQDTLLASDDWLRSVADETGGVSVVQTNDFARGFDQILEDNSQYYVLGYMSPSTARGFVAVSVKVDRPDLVVRARNGYVR